ncbi:hypothetical protein LTR64_007307 [Lithohypha guttulata]|uniref:uncharacterized protein n=1 Tax=Lithohypha guttulata TaxID=1690604 RepID=UPI002DE17D98|nr:hypothetical protein LTR51_004137 [Lithohypha guttulata]
MAASIGIKRPRDDDFEVPNLKVRRRATGAPQTVRDIPGHLWDALLNLNLVHFLRGVAWEGFDEHKGEDWEVWRYLGAGGFGSAAMWVRHGENGKLLDEVVIKSQRLDRGDASNKWILNGRHDAALSSEAVLQSFLNRFESENIVHLRGFKGYGSQVVDNVDNTTPTREWRLYLEYAPHGDLSTLRKRYKAFKMYFPEAFLWHVFHSLAKAAEQMGPYSGIPDELRNVTDDLDAHQYLDYLLHLDIKLDNIFLGYQEPYANSRTTGGVQGTEHRDQVPERREQGPEHHQKDNPLPLPYPAVKLGDFGCAELTSRSDFENPRVLSGGTRHWRPPEQHTRSHLYQSYDGHYGKAWGADDAPNGVAQPKLTEKMTIWSIGKVLFDLSCLGDAKHFDALKAKTAEEYKNNGDSTIRDWHRDPFAYDHLMLVSSDPLKLRSPYTQELTNLIRSCMHVIPAQRPSVRALVYRTSQHLRAALSKSGPVENEGSVAHQYLYFRGNEINHRPDSKRNCYHILEAWEYADIVQDPAKNDPNRGRLNASYDQQLLNPLQIQNLSNSNNRKLRVINEQKRVKERGRQVDMVRGQAHATRRDGRVHFIAPDPPRIDHYSPPGSGGEDDDDGRDERGRRSHRGPPTQMNPNHYGDNLSKLPLAPLIQRPLRPLSPHAMYIATHLPQNHRFDGHSEEVRENAEREWKALRYDQMADLEDQYDEQMRVYRGAMELWQHYQNRPQEVPIPSRSAPSTVPSAREIFVRENKPIAGQTDVHRPVARGGWNMLRRGDRDRYQAIHDEQQAAATALEQEWDARRAYEISWAAWQQERHSIQEEPAKTYLHSRSSLAPPPDLMPPVSPFSNFRAWKWRNRGQGPQHADPSDRNFDDELQNAWAMTEAQQPQRVARLYQQYYDLMRRWSKRTGLFPARSFPAPGDRPRLAQPQHDSAQDTQSQRESSLNTQSSFNVPPLSEPRSEHGPNDTSYPLVESSSSAPLRPRGQQQLYRGADVVMPESPLANRVPRPRRAVQQPPLPPLPPPPPPEAPVAPAPPPQVQVAVPPSPQPSQRPAARPRRRRRNEVERLQVEAGSFLRRRPGRLATP